jgi:hypothetical protein
MLTQILSTPRSKFVLTVTLPRSVGRLTTVTLSQPQSTVTGGHNMLLYDQRAPQPPCLLLVIIGVTGGGIASKKFHCSVENNRKYRN